MLCNSEDMNDFEYSDDAEESSGVVINSIMTKHKSSKSAFDRKKALDRPTQEAERMKKILKELSRSAEDECFAELLSKHRNLDKTLRIMAYILGWFPTFKTSSFFQL